MSHLQDLLVTGGQIYQPGIGLGPASDVRIRGGKIVELGEHLVAAGEQLVDASGCYVCGGFVDLRATSGEPGNEPDEDLCSLSDTAAAGGFTAVVVGPDTLPANDDHAWTELVLRRTREYGICEVLPMGALSERLRGESLAPMGEMAEAGAVLFGDGDRPVANSRLLRRAMEYARSFDRPICTQPLDGVLAAGGVMHEGVWSTRLGLAGIASAAEHIAVARDIAIAQLTGGRLHLARISSRRSVELVRQAKQAGVAVTCAVTPWHLRLTAQALQNYDSHLKLVAPLRDEDDRRALLAGLRDGTIDAICSDHMPVGAADKQVEFDEARPGAIGLQTVWSLVLQCVQAGELALGTALAALVDAPRTILRLPAADLVPGRSATLAILDPLATWTLNAQSSRSKSQNTVLWGQELRGQAKMTLLRGRVTWHDGAAR